MRSYKDVFFSTLDGDSLDPTRKELLCAAALEYSEFLIVSGSRSLLADVAQHIYAAVQIHPRCLLVPTSTVLATVEHFLTHAYLPIDVDRRFIKFDLNTGLSAEVPQLRSTDFATDHENTTRYLHETQYLHPVVKYTVEAACAQHSELSRHISRLLIGYSFLPDTLLRSKSLGTDFDGLQLHELKAFVDHIDNLKPTFSIFKSDIDSLTSYCNGLLMVCPTNATDLSNAYPTAALQNGFPCVYKVMSVMHYLGYELSMRRQLYNKAFMHIFRAYECYTAGALFLHNATIANYTDKRGTFPDVYILDAKMVLGFSPIYKSIGNHFNLQQTTDYGSCKFYIDLRNKFHYTHGDIKPSKVLVLEFARAVLRQILKIERIGNQQTFRWKDVYKQTKDKLLRDGSAEVAAAITRHLGIHPLVTLMET
ncbi:hypothetical protein [Pseudomonas aeruginosa]|uniref:hypothetical protein n=1 Tax=Pseudomonas aeruginosa TaxID=287 RepID=UPI000F5456D2|nr:hypothetical protein [Pseudomonas aeruginosa]MCC0414077.1 hypothetical protein [Pseudomonas aeruginosa]MCC0481665.1 hypothetical protein [Pseudomonas aeruginosa]MCM4074365.1 hypothetical protein [Pseudomonas aeruginosa]MCM4093250.1 hypothetical protein [Pseudomonas aeruginosa]MCM4106630.1 hypothetical protein [Pseudomonas aeruginosa]